MEKYFIRIKTIFDKTMLGDNETLPLIQSHQLSVKSSIFDRNRQLTIAKDYIEFDDNDLISKSPTKFDKEDIIGFRYGVKWINGYQFTIGRVYCIDIQNKQNKIIKLRLKSIYGIRKKLLTEKYATIVNTLYDNFFDNISKDYLSRFDNKIDFELAGLFFTQSGISLNKKSKPISWDNVGTASYKSYYTIFSKSDPSCYKAFEYLNDWNAGIIYSVSRQILKNKDFYVDS